MKYIHSKYEYPLELGSILLPRVSHQGEELKSSILEVSEDELSLLKQHNVFNELIKAGKYVIMTELPQAFISTTDKLKDAELEIERLKKELAKKDKVK